MRRVVAHCGLANATLRGLLVLALTASSSLMLATVASPAFADPTEEQLASARERFKEGIDLEGKSDWEGARKAFEEVAATKASAQVLYHLAYCDEHLGQWLAAVDGYDKALLAARDVGDSAKGVVETATKQRDELSARMPKLRIEIRGTLKKGDELYVDGKLMDLGVTVRDLKVDPGSHAAEIKRNGATLIAGTAEIAAGERGKLRLELPKNADGPAGPTAAPRKTGGGVGKIPAYVASGVGVAALIGSGVTFAMSRAAVDEVAASCEPDGVTGCDPALSGRAQDASTLTTVSLLLAGAGAAAVGTGVVLWFVLEDDEPAGGSRAGIGTDGLQPGRGFAIAPTLGGVLAVGRF